MSLDLGTTIKKLHMFRESSFPILSLYISLDVSDSKETLFKKIDTILSSLSAFQKEQFERHILEIKGYIESNAPFPLSKSLVFFTGNDELWEVIKTPFVLKDEVRIEYDAYLKPLEKVLNDFERYLVILADRVKARYFTLYKGSIEDQGEIYDDSVKRKEEGRSTPSPRSERGDKVERHEEYHLHEHLKLIAESIDTFAQDKDIAGVIIAGHKEIHHKMEKHLPKYLGQKIIGEIVADSEIKMKVLVEKCKEVIQKVNNGNMYKSTDAIGQFN